MYLELYDTFLLFKIKRLIYFHEISSNDRAPAYHTGATVIDAPILHVFFFPFSSFFLGPKAKRTTQI